MLKLERSRKYLFVAQVMEPIFRTMAEQSSRLRRTHVLQQPRIMKLNTIRGREVRTPTFFVLRYHAVLATPHTIEHQWRSARIQSILKSVKGALSGGPRPHPSPRSGNTHLTQRQAAPQSSDEEAEEPEAKGNPETPPTGGEALHGRYWSMGANPDDRLSSGAGRKTGNFFFIYFIYMYGPFTFTSGSQD